MRLARKPVRGGLLVLLMRTTRMSGAGEFASAERDEGRYAVLRQYHRVLLFAREMPRQDANAVEVGVAAHGQVSQVDGGVAERRVEGGRVGRIDRCLPALMAQGCQAQSHACFVL